MSSYTSGMQIYTMLVIFVFLLFILLMFVVYSNSFIFKILFYRHIHVSLSLWSSALTSRFMTFLTCHV